MSVEELLQVIDQEIEAANARILEAEERYAMEQESRDAKLGNKTPGELAIHWLQQPDTEWGRHAVCKAWLKNYEPNVGVFERAS